jgi:hypothetical protein
MKACAAGCDMNWPAWCAAASLKVLVRRQFDEDLKYETHDGSRALGPMWLIQAAQIVVASRSIVHEAGASVARTR